MRRFLITAVLMLAGLVAQAQTTGACQNGMAINKYGQPTGGVKVKVCADAACAQTLPTIYADSGLTMQRPNPFGADADGNYTYCAAVGSHFYEQTTYGNAVKTLDVTLPGGGGLAGFALNPQTGLAYSVSSNDFKGCKVVPVNPGSGNNATVSLPSPLPPAGQCVTISNQTQFFFPAYYVNVQIGDGSDLTLTIDTFNYTFRVSPGSSVMFVSDGSSNYSTVRGQSTGIGQLGALQFKSSNNGQVDGTGDWAYIYNGSQFVLRGGNLQPKSHPGVAYYVSQYPDIQTAINAAYGTGTVSGVVIDDRTDLYQGPGFYIPDSVTVQLAPVSYQFLSSVTHNNGNNNVTAAVVVEQGGHLLGASTSTNHGTVITVASGWTSDIIATTSVGTGIGGTAQWWHWGSIENLNINGANQTAGECVHVENMGETAKIANLLVKNCYSNNIEIVGASATQSAIANISTFRSQHGSGVRFTALAGVAKIDGLSGDCNFGSLVSVQENAAGSLIILGLKSEGEASVCGDSLHHDPVILMDGLAGFNDHVKIIGGYAFGTAQNDFAKFIGAGNAILELEGFYITGYTNTINDTVRTYTVPATNSYIKQPFLYEPEGTVFANQAFNLRAGTFIQGQQSTTPTEIFGATTASQTLLATLGNGDNLSIASGGIAIMGHNRAAYGTPPELMARWGYRWLGVGLGYDTTKFDLIPAWKSGDTTEKNIGNPLTVCQVGSTTVSCRWSNIYSLNVDTNALVLNGSAVAPSMVNPLMDGAATPGTSTNFAREGHVHPTDTSLVPKTTTVNGHALSGNVTVTASDVGAHHNISGTMQSVGSAITGNSGYQTVYSFTLPAGTFAVGQGARCSVRWTHNSGGSVAILFQWQLGSTAYTAQTITSGASTTNIGRAEIEIYTPSSLSSQVALTMPLQQGGATPVSGTYNTSSENLSSSATLKFSFNVANTEQVTPIFGYCETIQ